MTPVGGEAERIVLAINSGSSSLKFALFAMGAKQEHKLAEGAVERIGSEDARAWLRQEGKAHETKSSAVNHERALQIAFELVEKHQLPSPAVVGHRVVHGGSRHVQPELVSPALLASLRELVALAPLHMPACLAGIEAITARLPTLPQVACFDTAFHAGMPEVARRLPIPRRFSEIRRYGFHGLSYEYVMSTLGPDAPRRIVIAHLGNGASLVAIKDGRAIDTTMSFTPSGGVPMGTRSGDLDPGVLVYLARSHGLDFSALESLVEHESGLLAVGGSSDVKALLERAAADQNASLALEMFGYSIRKAIGAFTAALGGLDLLVFTGGIGEHAARIRAEACAGLQELGIELDRERNERSERIISRSQTATTVQVIPADEALVIARHARQVLRGATF